MKTKYCVYWQDKYVDITSDLIIPPFKLYSSSQHTTMSDSPRSGSSQPFHASFITAKGRERLPLLSEESLSQPKPQYTSGKKIPLPPTTPNNETYHGTLAGDPDDLGPVNETPKSYSESATQQQEEQSFSRSRPVSLFHNYNPQMVLENRGSTARDHLASERTFLAYVRTSLAFASAGVALVQLFTSSAITRTPGGDASMRFKNFAQPVGVSMVGMALITLGIGMLILSS